MKTKNIRCIRQFVSCLLKFRKQTAYGRLTQLEYTLSDITSDVTVTKSKRSRNRRPPLIRWPTYRFQDCSVGRYCCRARRSAAGHWWRIRSRTRWTWPSRLTARSTARGTIRNRSWTVCGTCRWTGSCPPAWRCPRTWARSGPASTAWWSRATIRKTWSPTCCPNSTGTPGPAFRLALVSFKSSSSAAEWTSTICCSASLPARPCGGSAPTTYR